MKLVPIMTMLTIFSASLVMADGNPLEPNTEFSWEQVGLTVSFTDDTPLDLNIVKWYWDFGDNTTSSERNPIHIYPGYGNYTASLQVWTSEGFSNIETQTVWVNPIYQPVTYTMTYWVSLALILSGVTIVLFGRLPSVRVGGTLVTFIGVITFLLQPSAGIVINTDSPIIIYIIPLCILMLITIGIAMSRNPSVRIGLVAMFLASVLVVSML